MDCRITSTKKAGQFGMTLVELLLATAVGSLVALGLAQLTMYSGRSFAAMANYVSLDRASRNALDTMSKQIRQTNKLTESTTTSLTFEDSDGGTLVFTYDPNSKKLIRSKNGVADAKPLLSECDYLRFSIFQRNPIGGSYDVYPTATATTCKLVQLSWICSRQIFGLKVNTESVQSSKIVIRKQ
jgi:prepilin-type N-terminal cleavage/methylation domain-containing protein